jgi:membrane-associated protease RseP (regulator of RpoE activity)
MEIFGTVWFWTLAALGFGFVIFIHELGHFVFAKWAGVRVDRFSIGFGPVIFRKQIGETEYALSLLPLGGYVKMLGQEDLPSEVNGQAKVDPRSYLAKTWWWQALILLGGVLFNLISSYIILLGIAWYGKPTIEPVVGSMITDVRDAKGVAQPSAAVRLGLRQGDRIVKLNGEKIRDFDGVQMAVISGGRQPIVLEVERRDEQGQLQRIRLPAEGPGVTPDPDFQHGRLTLGIQPISGTVIVGAAATSGKLPDDAPRVGDEITAINGVPVPAGSNGQELLDRLLPHAGTTVQLSLHNGDETRTVSLPYAGYTFDEGMLVGYPALVQRVQPGGPDNGLKPGDMIRAVNGQELTGSTGFIALTRGLLAEKKSFTVRVWRDGQDMDLSISGRDVHGRYLIGAEVTNSTGFLPILPTLLGGKPSPLVAAGVRPGDAIIDITAPKNKDDFLASFEIATISGGVRHVVALSNDDAAALAYEKRPGLLDKISGGVKPSMMRQLIGRQVVSVKDGVLELQTRDKTAVTVAPHGISSAGWTALLNGLQNNDWITGLVMISDGRYALEIMRGAEAPVSRMVKPHDAGVAILHEPLAMKIYQLENWGEAFSIANAAAYTMIIKTLQVIPRFFQPPEQGGLDPNKSLTGPIGIFTMLKASVERFGFIKYLELMALIGLNLFLINLLPIPITDGGQLLFLAIETVTKRPLAPWARNIAMWIGLVMVGFLMVYVIGLDVLRLTGVM